MLASNVQIETAGNTEYQNEHMGKIFREGFSFSGFERDKLYRNRGDGTFVDISGLSGLDSIGDGRGAAYGDFDNDGDLDVFLTALQKQVHYLYRNRAGDNGGHLRLALEGRASGRDAYGAVARLHTAHGILTRIKSGGSGFVSQSDPRLLFGLGADSAATALEVQWPSGLLQRFGPLKAGTSWRLVEGGSLQLVTEKPYALPDPAGGDPLLLAGLALSPGASFPPVPLVDLDGRETDFKAYRRDGTAYLVNLWATYCVPCRREMPHLQQLADDLADADVKVLGISLDTEEKRRQVRRFARNAGVRYPIFTSDAGLYPLLFSDDKVPIPLSFIVDRQGRLRAAFAGWSRSTEEQVRALLSER